MRLVWEEGEWLPVRVGLRKGYPMSPWLFNLFMDRVVMKANVRVLAYGAGRCWLLYKKEKKIWVTEHEMSQLLFADDIALVADSREKIQKFK